MAEKTDQMGWGEVDNDEVAEDVDAKEVEDCEKGSSMPWGRHIVKVVDSVPKEAHLKEYTCIAANLKMQIERTLEVEGSKVEDGFDTYDDRFIFDDILLFNEDEKAGMKNRRLLIAKRLGLISEGGGKISKKAWSEDIIGKRFIVTTEENTYISKKTDKEVTGQPKVSFAGYDTVDSVAGAGSSKSDEYGDI